MGNASQLLYNTFSRSYVTYVLWMPNKRSEHTGSTTGLVEQVLIDDDTK